MSRYVLLVLFALTSLLCYAEKRHDFNVNGVYYIITSDSTVSVAPKEKDKRNGGNWNQGNTQLAGEIIIPEKVTKNKKEYTVTGVADFAFNRCENITSIILPATVTAIGDFAFRSCKSLKSFKFPEKLIALGDAAFAQSGIQDMIFPQNITTIPPSCFASSDLQSITLSDNLTHINSFAFSNTPLKTINILTDNNVIREYTSPITFPSKLESISGRAFSGCTQLDSIIVPDGCKVIEAYTFFDIPNLRLNVYSGTHLERPLTNGTSELITKRKYTAQEEIAQRRKLAEQARQKVIADSIAKVKEAERLAQMAELMGEPKWASELSETKKAIIQELIDQMVMVEEGEFMMGNRNQKLTIADCEPLHKVHLSPFLIGKYEITQRQWGAVMGYNPSENGGDNHPVENVSWNDCQKFIRELKRLTGLNFTLPTEAQWEYAARGGNRSKGYYHSGTNNSEQIWYMFSTREGTRDVGLKCANELGIYDMSGNVYEWCLDKYDSYNAREVKNPRATADWDRYVIRGGSAYHDAASGSVSNRSWASSGYKGRHIGLRLAISKNYKPEKILTDADRERQSHPLVKQIRWANGISDKRKEIIAEAVGNMVKVPGGSYIFHGETGEYRPSVIKPDTKVSCAPFYMNRFEVTRDLWLAVLPDFDSFYLPNDALLSMSPTASVNYLSTTDIAKFLSELNRITGLKFTLPTEAQWEWAARGATESLGCTYAGTNNKEDITKNKKPNELGIYNLSDELWELCADKPTGSGGYPVYSVWRGGWDISSPSSIYRREVSTHSDWHSHRGFRIVLNLK